MIRLKPAQLVHYVAIAIHCAAVAGLTWASYQGFHALLGDGPDPRMGERLAMILSVCVAGMLGITLFYWRSTGSLGGFTGAVAFAALSLLVSLPLWYGWVRGLGVVTE